MISKILITGISGLIGSALEKKLESQNLDVAGLDIASLKESQKGNISEINDINKAIQGCEGVLHLGAVSRVVWGQNNPQRCWQFNVEGTRNVLKAALTSPIKPWVIFASSREVYGQQGCFPVSEDAGLKPMNIYGYSKVVGEQEALYARTLGIQTAIVRFSNVYGSTEDHATRVIPAFCKRALQDRVLKVEGERHIFDFTYIDDVSDGVMKLINFMMSEKNVKIPPIHFTSGRGTALRDLAHLVCQQAKSRSLIQLSAPRDFDVESFIGNPEFARELLGWETKTSLEKGLQRLLQAFKKKSG